MRNEIAILLADGFEEIEALAPADIWRRLAITSVHALPPSPITDSSSLIALL